MKLKRNIFLFALTVIFFCGCRKDHPTTHTVVQGQVLEYGSNHPLANMQVLIGIKSSLMGPYSTMAVVNSDANGKYEYTFDGVSGDIYVVACTNVSPYSASSFYSITVGQINDINITLLPPGWLKLHVKNIHHSQSFDFYLNHNSWNLTDTVTVLGVGGNEKTYIEWIVRDSLNITTTHNDSIYIPAFDTVPYSINY